MILRLRDARGGAKVEVEPAPEAWRVGVDANPNDLPSARRAAVTGDLVAAALSVVGQPVLPADTDHPATIWVGPRPGPSEAIWVCSGPVGGEFGGIDDATWRLLCLQHHYQSPLDVTPQIRSQARTALLRLQRAYKQLVREAPGGVPDPRPSVQGQRFLGQIHAALLDDLATPEALAVLQQVLDHDIEPGEQLRLLLEANRLLGLALA